MTTNDPVPNADGQDEASRSLADRSAETTPERLASIAGFVTPGLVAYAAVALALLVLSLLRGRLVDALIIVVVLLFTMPVILGYRRQTLRPHRRTDARGAVTGDEPAPGRDER